MMCRKGSVVHSLGLNVHRGGGAMVWTCLFHKAAVARVDHLLACPLAKPWAVKLLWYPDIRGRLGCAQRAKSRSKQRGLQRERETKP